MHTLPAFSLRVLGASFPEWCLKHTSSGAVRTYGALICLFISPGSSMQNGQRTRFLPQLSPPQQPNPTQHHPSYIPAFLFYFFVAGVFFCPQSIDLGLEGTFLNEVLYKNATFLNLVDPISHDLLMSLARDLQCPKKEYDPWKSSDRICRQLIYHLTPHSKWHRHGMPRRKSQMCRAVRAGSMDLSGIPLTMRDVHRMAYYLQNNGDHLTSVDLSFTELNDDMVRLLLPFLWALPKLTHLSLNGNRLTRATMKELTDTMKDMNKFPCLAWVDLGNNVDVSSMPQPLLVGLRKRLSQQTTLPTIYEALDCDPEIPSGQEGGRPEDEEAGSTPRHREGKEVCVGGSMGDGMR
uniref:Leucine rich repeat containing 75B n=1 Tax=Meleagris gallopavo TaxID=9103 RepID=A0A803XVQ2_MELGA